MLMTGSGVVVVFVAPRSNNRGGEARATTEVRFCGAIGTASDAVDGLALCPATDSTSGYCELNNKSGDMRLDCGRVCKVFEPLDECVEDSLQDRALLIVSEVVGRTFVQGTSIGRGCWE